MQSYFSYSININCPIPIWHLCICAIDIQTHNTCIHPSLLLKMLPQSKGTSQSILSIAQCCWVFSSYFWKYFWKKTTGRRQELNLGGERVCIGGTPTTDRSRHHKTQETTAVILIFVRWTGFLCWSTNILVHISLSQYLTTMITYYAPVWKAVLRWWAEWLLHMWPGRVNSMVSITRWWAPNWKSRELIQVLCSPP